MLVTDILTSGSDYFPGWVSILFSLGLALGIIHHLPCLIFGHGNRWFHGGHATMALSMIYMYLSMSYNWNWLPAAWQMWFFVATSVALAAYLTSRIIRRQPFNALWALLLIQHAAMIYMWYPMMGWNAIVIFVLVSWFAIETFGWVADLLPDEARMRANSSWIPYEIGSRQDRATTAEAEQPFFAPANPNEIASAHPVAIRTRQAHEHLVSSQRTERTLMAIMAASMGYMFYGMELMRPCR